MNIRLSWGSAVAAVAGLAIVACSSSSSSSNVSASQACSDLGNAVCNKLNSCASLLINVDYGSISTCATRASLTCPNALSAPGSAATPADVESCAKAYGSASCSDLESNVQPSACQIAGTETAGTVCGDDQQCVGPNGYCKIAAGAICGACGTKAGAGSACAGNNDCQSGLVCGTAAGATSGSCVTAGAAGATCDTAHPCGSPLVCANTTCSQPVGAGGKCDSTAQNCDFTQGLFCNPMTSVCASVATAAAGAACGYSNGTYTVCTAGATCNAGATGVGTCEAPAADGAACSLTAGPQCLSPASCVNSVCTIPNPASCH